jgi:hypothetical protein
MDFLEVKECTTKLETIRAAEKACAKKIKHMQGEFRCKTQQLNTAVITAYVRSNIRYHYVPLYAARMVTNEDVERREAIFVKKELGIAPGANKMLS